MFGNGSIPTPSQFLASSSVWYTAFVADWLYLVYIAVGIFAVIFAINFLISVFHNGFNKLTISQEEKEAKAGSWEASRAMWREHNKK